MAEVRAEQEVTLIRVDDGGDGRGILSTEIKYGTSDSASTQPSSWSATVPTSIAKGKWLWVRTVINYTDNTSNTTYQKSYIGTDGEDGKSVYIQSATKDGNTTTVVIADSDGNTNTLTIVDGEDGSDGTPGAGGYVHTAWANSADGTTDFSTTVSAGKKYLGVYTDHTQADSTSPSAYSWSLIKGEKGDTGADSGNMLLDVYAPSTAKVNAAYDRYFSESGNSSTVCSFVPAGDEKLPDPNAKCFVRIENTETGKTRGFCFYDCPNKENAIGLVVGETYRVSCWVRQLTGSSNFSIYIGGDGGGTEETDTVFVPTSKWQKFERIFTFNDRSKTSDVWSRLYFYNKAGNDIAGAGTGIGAIDMCGFKLERINAITASGRNVCLRTADYNGWGKDSNVTFDGNVMTLPKTTTKKWRNAWQTVNLPYSVVRNQKITITYKIKAASGQIPCVVFSLGISNGETATRLKHRNRYTYTIANGEWQTVAMSAYITDKIFGSTATSGTPDYDNGYFHILVGTPDYYLEEVQIKEIMVALGSDPCAWSPAPEDSTAYTDESIDAIEIGGRNLVWDTEWKKISTRWTNWGSPTTREIVTTNGKRWLHLVTTASSYQGYSQAQDKRNGYGEIKAGDKVVISYSAYAKTAGQICTVGCHWKNSSGTIVAQNWFASTLTTTEKRYVSGVFTIPNNAVGFNVMVGDGTANAQELWISQVKIEFGTKATDWAPAPEDEVNARKLLIREVKSGSTQGIEVGYENGSYKAFINAAGSFDVITASGETVATFSEESTMRSVRTETWDVHGIEREVEVEAWQQLTPDGTQFYKREHSIDEDFYYDKSQSTIIDAYGIKPQGSGAIFTLGANVRAPNETRLWHMKTGSGSYMIEGTWFGAGYITSSRTKVNFTIPLAVPVVEGASVSCYTMDATMRQGGKYILGDGDSTKDVDPSYVTVTTCPSGLNISIGFPSALSGATNNDAVGIVCNYYISVGAVS